MGSEELGLEAVMSWEGMGSAPAGGLLPSMENLLGPAGAFWGPTSWGCWVQPASLEQFSSWFGKLSRRGTELPAQERKECAVGFPLPVSVGHSQLSQQAQHFGSRI